MNIGRGNLCGAGHVKRTLHCCGRAGSKRKCGTRRNAESRARKKRGSVAGDGRGVAEVESRAGHDIYSIFINKFTNIIIVISVNKNLYFVKVDFIKLLLKSFTTLKI